MSDDATAESTADTPLIVIDPNTWYVFRGEVCEAHAKSRYSLALEILKQCTLGELNRLVLTDLRPIQMAAGGVPYTPKAFVPPPK